MLCAWGNTSFSRLPRGRFAARVAPKVSFGNEDPRGFRRGDAYFRERDTATIPRSRADVDDGLCFPAPQQEECLIRHKMRNQMRRMTATGAGYTNSIHLSTMVPLHDALETRGEKIDHRSAKKRRKAPDSHTETKRRKAQNNRRGEKNRIAVRGIAGNKVSAPMEYSSFLSLLPAALADTPTALLVT